MPRHELDDDWRDRISAYALGAMNSAESTEFELHLNGPCETCIEEVAAARAVLARVGLSAKPVAPPAHVFDKLMKSVRGEPVQTWKQWPASFAADTNRERMEKDSTHPVQWTKGGCTLLLLSSRHDELLA